MMIARRRPSAISPCDRGSPGDRDCPILEFQRPLIARQYDISSLVQECANPTIAALRDAAGLVDLARLIATRHETEISADVAGSAEAFGIINRRRERDTRNAH